MGQKILLVDDEPNILKALSRLLDRHGYRVFRAGSGAEAMQVLQLYACQVVLTDFRMPQMDGAALLANVKRLYPDTVCLVLSGYADFQSVLTLLNSGTAFRFLQKPWEDQQMLQEVAAAFQYYRAQRDQQIRDQQLINSQSALLELDESGQILRANGAAAELLHTSPAALAGSLLTQWLALSPAALAEFWRHDHSEPLVLRSDVQLYELQRQYCQQGYLLLKISARQQASLLQAPPLPAMLEQAQLEQQLTQQLSGAGAEGGVFALAALRLKNYGEWADVLGFARAGELFATFSRRLLQSSQRFGSLTYLANEVFLLFLPHAADEMAVHQQLSEIQASLKPDEQGNGACYPKLAISYCMAPQDGDSARQLITNVLISNRIQLNNPLQFYSRFSDTMAEKKRQQLRISDASYHAVELDQLELHFQVKLDVATNRCDSAEALLRWHHPQLGMVSPALFIPVAEQDGQINEIGL